MSMEINNKFSFPQFKPISGVDNLLPKTNGPSAPEGGKQVSFSEFFMNQFNEANKTGLEAEQAIQRSILGQESSPHEAMIAVQKADISMTLLMSLKERIERAYQELIRTPI